MTPFLIRSVKLCSALFLLALTLSLLGVRLARASNWVVTSPADSGPGSLREAIDLAASGDTISFNLSSYPDTIILTSGELVIEAKELTIIGPGADRLIISGNDNRVFRIYNFSSNGTVAISGLTIANGYVDSFGGGGLYIEDSAVTLNVANCTFSGNYSVGTNGGGILNNGTLNVANSTFSGNHADSGDGGGIFNSGTLNVTNSTFAGNSATNGGGIYNGDLGAALNVTNSTFSGNSATYGGGLYNGDSGFTLNVTNSTFSGNSATDGGGLYNGTDASATLVNTIVANSPTGGNCGGDPITIDSHNNLQYGDSTCGADITGDPKLGALANHGGPTQTFALLAGSAALDQGDDTVCAAEPVNNLDQRGRIRMQDPVAVCDIGAFEQQAVCFAQASGSWSSSATWDCGDVPWTGQDVTIDSGRTVTLDTGTADIKNLTLDGALQHEGSPHTLALTGGWTNNGTFTPGSAITVQFDGSISQAIGGSAVSSFFNIIIGSTATVVGPAETMHVGGNWTNDGTFTPNNGTVVFDGGGTQTISGATTFYNLTANGGSTLSMASAVTVNGTFEIGGGITSANNLTINGTAQINAGGAFDLAPMYGSNSTLVYTPGGPYTVRNEWTAGSDPGRGVPLNVTIQNGTAVAFGSEVGTRTVPGNFTLTSGSLTLVGDLVVKGNWSNGAGDGAFSANGSLVAFTGSAAEQSVTGATTFASLSTANANGVVFSDDTTVTKDLAISSGSMTAPSGSLYVAGNWTNNGTFVPNGGDVHFNGTSTIGGSAVSSFFDITIDTSSSLTAPSGSLNVGGNWTNNGTFTHNHGTVVFNGSGTQTISGATTFNNLTTNSGTALSVANAVTVNGTFQTGGGITGANNLTLNGTAQINAGSAFDSAPTYGSSATLVYNAGKAYPVGNEWITGSDPGCGVPLNVTIQSSTDVSFGNGGGTRTVPGDFTLTGGSLTLSGMSGEDLVVKGDWSNSAGNSAFNANGRLVAFTGSLAQSVTGNTTFAYLTIDNPSGVVFNDDTRVNHGLVILNGSMTAPSSRLYVAGNWTNNGIFLPNGGAVHFNGTSTIGGSAVSSFFDIAIEASSSLTAPNGSLNVGGNWTNNGTFTHNNGTVVFNGSGTQTISGDTTFYNVTIGGSSVLQTSSNVTVTGVTHITGSVTSESRLISANASYNFGLAGGSATFIDRGSLSSLQIIRTESAHPHENDGGFGAKILDRYYTLTPNANPTRANFCFDYTDAEVSGSGLVERQLILCRWTGSAWSCRPRGLNSSTVSNLVCADNLNEFSDWVLRDAGPTAVSVTGFYAAPDMGLVRVKWQTTLEVNMVGFNLYRSASPDGPRVQVNQQLIPPQVPGQPGGASYEFVDHTIEPGVTYYYWLEAVELTATQILGPATVTANYVVYLPYSSK